MFPYLEGPLGKKERLRGMLDGFTSEDHYEVLLRDLLPVVPDTGDNFLKSCGRGSGVVHTE